MFNISWRVSAIPVHPRRHGEHSNYTRLILLRNTRADISTKKYAQIVKDLGSTPQAESLRVASHPALPELVGFHRVFGSQILIRYSLPNP